MRRGLSDTYRHKKAAAGLESGQRRDQKEVRNDSSANRTRGGERVAARNRHLRSRVRAALGARSRVGVGDLVKKLVCDVAGVWSVVEQMEGVTYATTGYARKVRRVPVESFAPRETALYVARMMGLLDKEDSQ